MEMFKSNSLRGRGAGSTSGAPATPSGVHDVPEVAALVDRTIKEYQTARAR